MEINGQLSLWDMLADVPEQEVKVAGALNVHARPKVTEFDVTLTTGDLILIVSMVEDYIKGLDVIKQGDMQWDAYYRAKFRSISDKIQKAIEYDYEKAVEKCKKKQAKEDDIGEEAMALMIKKAKKEAERKEAERKAKDEQIH